MQSRDQSPVPTKMAQRRPHTKSRQGCQTCRRRRIKCDEERPECRNCLIHGVLCDYAMPFAGAHLGGLESEKIDNRYPRNHHDQPNRPSVTPLSPPLNQIDNELMYNFVSSTVYSMTQNTHFQTFLYTTLVGRAFVAEYIMHALLSVSALHLAHSESTRRDRLVEVAIVHYNKASAKVVVLMDDLQAQDWADLHLFSVLAVYFALGKPKETSHDGCLTPVWMQLLLGMEPAMRLLDPERYQGFLQPLFAFGKARIELLISEPPSTDTDLFLDLENNLNASCRDDSLLPVYLQFVKDLRIFYTHVLYNPHFQASATQHSHGNDPMNHSLEAQDLLVWLSTNAKVLRRLIITPHMKQEAMVLFAHCLLVVKRFESQWWLCGWAEYLMALVWEQLTDFYRSWVDWPARELGIPSHSD